NFELRTSNSYKKAPRARAEGQRAGQPPRSPAFQAGSSGVRPSGGPATPFISGSCPVPVHGARKYSMAQKERQTGCRATNAERRMVVPAVPNAGIGPHHSAMIVLHLL